MSETLSDIGQYGGLVILAGLFVWTYIQEKNENKKMLERIDKSIETINSTVSVLKEYIIKHDERAERIDNNVIELIKKEK